MPKVGLSLGSSFEELFHTVTDPSKLYVFNCLCFPWLRPYSSHKLDPKSSMCVIFFSYSLTQSVFLCFDPTLKKIFMSDHVKLVENVFPFSSLPTPASSVKDTNSRLPASLITSGDLPTPPSLTNLPSTLPSPSLTSNRPKSRWLYCSV